MPNTPLLGAVAKVAGLIELDELVADVEKSFSKKFSSKIVSANIEAIKQAYQEVK